MKYDYLAVEKKWQDKWEQAGVFRAVDEHSHDQFVVDLCRALDDIEMTPGDRVE